MYLKGQQVVENILLKYCNCYVKIVKDIPKIKIELKDCYKVGKEPPRRDNKKPYSGSSEYYWTYYLGEEGIRVYRERRKLFPKVRSIEWALNYLKLSDFEKQKLQGEDLRIRKKLSNSIKAHYSGPTGEATRAKLRKRSAKHAGRTAEINRRKWLDPKWKASEMKRRHTSGQYRLSKKRILEWFQDENNHRAFIEACNDPERIERISEASRLAWQERRLNDPDQYHRMVTSHKNRNYEVDGKRMNSIEYLIATYLKSRTINYEFEPLVNVGTTTYIPDFKVGTKLIECFGDFWHGNPRFYSKEQFTHKTKQIKNIWKHDSRKIALLRKNNYTVLVLWEYDIRNNLDKCKRTINEYLTK